MSNQRNQDLMERAQECIDYFYGKLPAKVIEHDIDTNDLDALFHHVQEAEAEMSRQTFHNYDLIGDNDAY